VVQVVFLSIIKTNKKLSMLQCGMNSIAIAR